MFEALRIPENVSKVEILLRNAWFALFGATATSLEKQQSDAGDRMIMRTAKMLASKNDFRASES
jgi:hypothetical protein